jgi:DNA-directed RNA polymerase specialized sigma24 family protein
MHKVRAFDPERGNRFSSWMGLLAINASYDFLRTLKRRPLEQDISDAVEIVSDAPDAFEAEGARRGARNRAPGPCQSHRYRVKARVFAIARGEAVEAIAAVEIAAHAGDTVPEHA